MTKNNTLLLSGNKMWGRLSVDSVCNKAQRDATRDFIWITSSALLDLGQSSRWWVASSGYASPPCPKALTPIIIHAFFSFLAPAVTFISTVLSLLTSTWQSLFAVSFPVAGNSHNCWPELPFVAGGRFCWTWILGVCKWLANRATQYTAIVSALCMYCKEVWYFILFYGNYFIF